MRQYIQWRTWTGLESPQREAFAKTCSVTVIFDQCLQFSRNVGIHPNDNTASIWLDFKSLRRVIEDHGNPVKTMKFE